MLAYFDLPAAELRLVRCERATRRCDAPRLLDGAVAQGDYTDYGAGAFPEMRVGPDGHPVLVYFSTAAVTGAGELSGRYVQLSGKHMYKDKPWWHKDGPVSYTHLTLPTKA